MTGMAKYLCVLASLAFVTPVLAGTADKTPAPTAAKIGVEPCDGYLATYRACVDAKADEREKFGQLDRLERVRRRWVYLASKPETRAQLPAICESTWGPMAEQLTILGCK